MTDQKYDKLTVQQYMKLNGIKSTVTVYNKIKKGIINAEDLNNGRGERPCWRIIVPRNTALTAH